MNKAVKILLFIGSGLPLILYPGLLFANLMSIAAGAPSDTNVLLLIASGGFLWGGLLYPLVYIASLIGFFIVKTESKKKIAIAIPYAYLGLIFLFFLAWIGLES